MIEVAADLWELAYAIPPDALCVTTNMSVTPSGHAIMGGGVAGEAARRWPELPARYGGWLGSRAADDPVTWALWVRDGDGRYSATALVMLPTKRRVEEGADLGLIEQALQELVHGADEAGWNTVYVPRPGSGLGGLAWEDVRPLCQAYLDRRFLVVRYPGEAL